MLGRNNRRSSCSRGRGSLSGIMRRLATLLALGLFVAIVVNAAKKFPFTAAPNVPAARGHVEFSSDKNGNNKVQIKVEHLAPPGNLTPARNSYVIWVQQPNGDPTVQDLLRVDKNLKAEFETTIPWNNFDVFVTAEDAASPQAPAGPEVLRATIRQSGGKL
jgi:hypothetical protein